jgi:GNAT superfamily N-acetyltransferase
VDDAVALCIHGDSLWHRLGLAALGVGWEERDGIARRTGSASQVFLGAMTLGSTVTAEQLAAATRGLSGNLDAADSWDRLDMEPLGWRRGPRQPWMLRESSALVTSQVDGLRVLPVRTPDEVGVFERTIFEATEGNPDWAPAGSVHPSRATLAVGGLTLLLAWLDRDPVGTCLAAVDERVLHVTAVSVLPTVRGRGIGAALTAAAVGLAPDRPATLASTTLGHGVYVGLGFRDVGRRALWEPPSPEDGRPRSANC